MKQSNFQPEPMLYVLNKSDETFIDRYNGEDFEIKPGECLSMPIEAAKLCLGYGDGEKGRVLARLGWAKTPAHFKAGLARLNQFSFHGSEQEAAREANRGSKGQTHAPLGAGTSSSLSGEDEVAGSSAGRPLLGKIARAQEQAPA